MDFNEFIKKNNVRFDNDIINACHQGLDIMRNSRDPNHNIYHINSLLKEISIFINSKATSINLDYDTLITSICWHDTWYAKREQTQNYIIFFYRYIFEAIGSANLFQSSVELDIKRKKLIASAIRSHVRTGFIIDNFFRPKSIESKILKDFDELDCWNIKRFERIKNNYFGIKKLTTSQIRMVRWYFFNIILQTSPSIFNFKYTKNMFIQKRDEVISWFIHLYKIVYENADNYVTNPSVLYMTPNELKKRIFNTLDDV